MKIIADNKEALPQTETHYDQKTNTMIAPTEVQLDSTQVKLELVEEKQQPLPPERDAVEAPVAVLPSLSANYSPEQRSIHGVRGRAPTEWGRATNKRLILIKRGFLLLNILIIIIVCIIYLII